MDEKLKHLSIAKKLRYSFGCVLLATSVIFVAAIISLGTVLVQFRSFYATAYRNDTLQMEIRKDIQVIGKMVLWSLTTDDNAVTTEKLDLAEQYSQNVASNIEALEASYHNKAIISELNSAVSELKSTRLELINLARANKNDEALEFFNGAYNDITEKVQDILIEIGDASSSAADSEYTIAFTIGIIASLITAIIFAVSIAISSRIRKTLVQIIMEPMSQIEAAAEKLRNGELDVDITYDSKDEFGKLANNLKESCHSLHEIVTDAGRLLTEIANGNFNVNTDIEEQYTGEFVSLIQAMRNMNRKLNETLHNINISSDQVAIGSSQLAESATEQAGAIEELTATIENINESAAATAKEAKEASEKAKQAELDAEKSQSDLIELTNAMQRINDTSRMIQNIIGEIEDIASQTNLLSLNASIEAARAGDAGRGFGVVADQIGKLADDSAKSAVNTRELIERSLVEIENGNEITKKTVAILNNILNSMKSFADIASKSSETAISQSDMLAQVEKAIEQISEVVQSNSASAEETSATSEELSAQAETLKNLISQFQFR